MTDLTICTTSEGPAFTDGNGAAIVARYVWVNADGAIRTRNLRADQTMPATFEMRLAREGAIAAWAIRPENERAACIIQPHSRELRLRKVLNAPRGFRYAA